MKNIIAFILLLPAICSFSQISQTKWQTILTSNIEQVAVTSVITHSGKTYIAGSFTSKSILLGNILLAKNNQWLTYEGDFFIAIIDNSDGHIVNAFKYSAEKNATIHCLKVSDYFIYALISIKTNSNTLEFHLLKYDLNGKLIKDAVFHGDIMNCIYFNFSDLIIDEQENIYLAGTTNADSFFSMSGK